MYQGPPEGVPLQLEDRLVLRLRLLQLRGRLCLGAEVIWRRNFNCWKCFYTLKSTAYPSRVILMEMCRWADLFALLRVMQSQRDKQFTVKASRDIICAALLNVYVATPFNKDVRTFVNIDSPAISKIFSQILSALDLATRADEKGRLSVRV